MFSGTLQSVGQNYTEKVSIPFWAYLTKKPSYLEVVFIVHGTYPIIATPKKHLLCSYSRMRFLNVCNIVVLKTE